MSLILVKTSDSGSLSDSSPYNDQWMSQQLSDNVYKNSIDDGTDAVVDGLSVLCMLGLTIILITFCVATLCGLRFLFSFLLLMFLFSAAG